MTTSVRAVNLFSCLAPAADAVDDAPPPVRLPSYMRNNADATLRAMSDFSVIGGALRDFFSLILSGKDPNTAQQEANDLVRRSNALVQQIREQLPSLSGCGEVEARLYADRLSAAARKVADASGVTVYAAVEAL
jgi:hypothetical protein